jgi:hypothetical protein
MGVFTDKVSNSTGRDGVVQAGGNISYGDVEVTKQILSPGESLPKSTHWSSGDPPDERRSSGSLTRKQVARLERPFFEVETVALLMWLLPPRTMTSRRQHIYNTWLWAFTDSSPCCLYALILWNGTPGHLHCYHFHSIQSRNLIDFHDERIHIETFRASKLASVPVFYTCNFSQAAYEHLLLAHRHVMGDVDLHVSVFVFNFDSDVLLGLKPQLDMFLLFSNLFPNVFCNSNHACRTKFESMSNTKQMQYFHEKPSTYEIIIALICTVGSSFLHTSESAGYVCLTSAGQWLVFWYCPKHPWLSSATAPSWLPFWKVMQMCKQLSFQDKCFYFCELAN